MIRAVIDTNVIVSAHLKEHGWEAKVFQLALAGRFELCTSDAILSEYESTLRRTKFSLNPKRIEDSLAAIRSASTIVVPTKTVTASPDPDDNKFMECAEEGEANYLVTGNRRHIVRFSFLGAFHELVVIRVR